MYLSHKKMNINKEEVFEVISNEAWTILFYQICKLYVEPQISEKGLVKISSKPKDDEGWKINGSTLYSEY